MGSKNKISREDAERMVKECFSIADFCRKVGWVPRGDNYKIFHKYVKEYGLDISHFTGQKTNIGNVLNKHRELTAKQYINNNTIIRGSTLIKKLVNEGLKEYRCEKCKNTEWLGEKIALEVHHVNGVNSDNRIENILLLCPNCHAFTDNYRGKKNKKTHHCSMCGKEITKYSKSGLCDKCVKEKNRKFELPSKYELIEAFKEYKTFCGVGKIFGCSDNVVRKWCRKYGLPIHTKELKQFINNMTS